MSNPQLTSAISMTVISGFLMATAAALFKWVSLPAEVVIFFRMLLGALFLIVFLRIRGLQTYTYKFRAMSFFAGICLSAVFILYMHSLSYLNMAIAIMFVYLGPLIATVVAHFFFREYLTPVKLLLIALATCGFILIQDFNIDDKSGDVEGYIYGLGSAIFYALFVLLNRRPVPKSSQYNHILTQMFSGAMFCVPFIYNFSFNISGQQWVLLLAIGLLPGCIAILLATLALQRLDTATFNVLIYVDPIFVAILGWILFQETLNIQQLSGISIIIMCSAFLAINSKKSISAESS